MEVFRTVHGSHLYGLAHPGSDRDTFIVTFEDTGKAHQTMVGKDDVVRVGWRTFLSLAASGSHQSCEALFSTKKEWTPEGRALQPLIDGMRVTGGEVAHKYERTIRKFSHGNYKMRRHGARLSLSLRGLRDEGRFDPTLTTPDRRWASLVAIFEGEELLNNILSTK